MVCGCVLCVCAVCAVCGVCGCVCGVCVGVCVCGVFCVCVCCVCVVCLWCVLCVCGVCVVCVCGVLCVCVCVWCVCVWCVCVCVCLDPHLSSTQCACAILPSVVCPTLQYFPKLSHKRHDFRKKMLLNKFGIWIFFTKFRLQYLILKIIQRDGE